MEKLLIACDFDGTITQHDTLHLIVRRYGDGRLWESIEPRLRAGELTLEQAMQEEFAGVRATPEQVRDLVLRDAGLRAGFAEFVAWAREGGHRLVVLSSGFRSVIDAVLGRWGLGHLEVASHEAEFSADGCRLVWADRGERCAVCGRRCKRHDVRARHAGETAGADRRRRVRPLRRADGRGRLRPRPPRPRPGGRRRAVRPLRGLPRGARGARGPHDPGGMSPRGWREVPPAADWVAMEERVLAAWRERDVFRRSLEARRGAPPYVFYEGPPTANGRPYAHHVLARVFKDIFPRFHTMRGRFVDRRGGWDCHGLPVEIEIEKRLGISGKPQIEAYGIAEFNALCRESVVAYVDEWERLTERIGFWIDTERAYRTMDAGYIESVWWSLAELHRRDLLYQSHKVVPYCPRCGTALSSHEVALGYEEVDDPSILVRFPLADALRESLLVWTTTPWTLPANQAAAVRSDVAYAAVERDGETLILAEPLVERVLGEGARATRLIPAGELVGRHYLAPFPYVEGPHVVVAADFVTTEDGTGIVHIAPAFGEDDMDVARRHGFPAPNPVGLDGRYTDAVGPWAGRAVKEADADLIADLDRRDLLVRAETHRHQYPHCWRCGTPLLYYAKPSWYVRTTAVVDRMLELNRGIGWHPERVRDGRFGRWLEGNVNWAISRDRYWGTPLPLWRCADCDRIDAIGSFEELRERATAALPEPFDPHRPFVDAVVLTCPCGGAMAREPEVIDVWYDSGAMPFAQERHPFATGGDLSGRFPADFVCEALDQTRGWFYSLLAESTLLFDETAYRNVVCLGLILDAEGQKMSKSKGNVIEPWTVLDRQGADAFRWYLLTAQSPWDSFRFSLEAVDEAMRRFLLTLWNTFTVPGDLRRAARRLVARRRRRRGCPPADRPLDPVAAGCDGRGGHRAARGLRRHRRRPGARGVPRRSLQLVRARVAPALLGRARGRRRRRAAGGRRGRVRDPSRVPAPRPPCWSRPSARSSPRRCTAPWWRRTTRRRPRASISPPGPRRGAGATRAWRTRWRSPAPPSGLGCAPGRRPA